jgi:hypothetical protein
MSLLSLNDTTLYYFFLSDRPNVRDFSTGINHWAAAIPDNANPGNNRVASTSASRKSNKPSNHSQVPALTNATSRSSNASVLTKNIVISQDVAVKENCIVVAEIGLEDEDETRGVERDAALNSPPKGKIRISSAVSNHFFTHLTLRSPFFNRILLKNQSPYQLLLPSGIKRSITRIFPKTQIKGFGGEPLYQHTCNLPRHNLILGTSRLRWLARNYSFSGMRFSLTSSIQ